MAGFPETRLSLIAKVQGAFDPGAWSEFVDVYWPAIYRLARRRGLQHADAEDLAQQVLISASRSVGRWSPDESRGRFRAWLGRIAENLAINALARRRPDRGAGGPADADPLGDPAAPGEDSALIRLESRREIFRWAAERIRPEFQAETWDAFWLTAVEGLGIEEAAQTLGKTSGSVYAARSRVMRRLKAKVLEWESEG